MTLAFTEVQIDMFVITENQTQNPQEHWIFLQSTQQYSYLSIDISILLSIIYIYLLMRKIKKKY